MSGWVHIRDSEPRGKKEYRCFLCGYRIRKGAKHVNRFGYYDGEAVDMRMHAVCESLTHEWDWMDWETFSYGDLPVFELTAVAAASEQ